MIPQDNYQAVWGDDILLNNDSYVLLKEIARWAKFLSIVGFVFLILMLLAMLSAVFMMSGMDPAAAAAYPYPYSPALFTWTYAVIYLLMIGIYFLPLWYLYKFSVRTRRALDSNHTVYLNEAFRALKNHYLIIGILTIIGLTLFVVSCVLMMMGFQGFL